MREKPAHSSNPRKKEKCILNEWNLPRPASPVNLDAILFPFCGQNFAASKSFFRIVIAKVKMNKREKRRRFFAVIFFRCHP
jgi:hypothetical protein